MEALLEYVDVAAYGLISVWGFCCCWKNREAEGSRFLAEIVIWSLMLAASLFCAGDLLLR